MFALTWNIDIEHKENAIITVGIIKDRVISYTVYGENAMALPQTEYTYEIGSITKTFTCSFLSKAIFDEKLVLTDSINKYIDLPSGNNYPTFERIATHTSGYSNYYFNW